jgi:hypothetical protein
MKRRPHGLVVFLGWFALAAAVTVLMFGFITAEFVLLVACAPRLVRAFGTPTGLGLFFLGLIGAFALAVAVHEAGHLVAGRLAGMFPRFAHVGPITFTRRAGRWRVGWDPRQPWLGGRADCDFVVADRTGLAVLLAGGPAANFLAGGAAFALALSSSWPLMQAWAGQVAILSLIFGAFNLLPLRERWFDSDGLALWRVLFGRPR